MHIPNIAITCFGNRAQTSVNVYSIKCFGNRPQGDLCGVVTMHKKGLVLRCVCQYVVINSVEERNSIYGLGVLIFSFYPTFSSLYFFHCFLSCVVLFKIKSRKNGPKKCSFLFLLSSGDCQTVVCETDREREKKFVSQFQGIFSGHRDTIVRISSDLWMISNRNLLSKRSHALQRVSLDFFLLTP